MNAVPSTSEATRRSDARASRPSTARALYAKFGVLPILIILGIVIFTLGNPRFLSANNFLNIMQQSTFLMLIAFGQMMVLISGGFDLSVGSNVALTSIVSATVMVALQAALPGSDVVVVVVSLVAALGLGALIGATNAVGVSVLNVNPFIATLATSSVFSGLTLLISKGMQVGGLSDLFVYGIGSGTVLGIPLVVLITIPIAVAMYLMMNWTSFGRYVFATGSNARAALIAGVGVKKVLFSSYVLCGVLTSFSSFMLTARVSAGQPLLGAEFPLMSITAAIIGGCSLKGGQGSVVGTILGVIFVTLVSNGMNLMRLGSYYQMIVLGVVLVAAVVLDQQRAASRR